MKIKIDWNSLFPLDDIIGKEAIAILDDNTEIVGVIEAPSKFSGMYPVLRVSASDQWVRLGDEIELVNV